MEESEKNQVVKETTWQIPFKSLSIVGGLVILFQIGLFLTINDNNYNITDTVYLTLLGLIGIMAITSSRKENFKEKINTKFLFLGIGYLLFLTGDIAFYYYDYVLEIDPYPSPFDILFLVGYFFISLHFVSLKKYFQIKLTNKEKRFTVLIPIIVSAFYAITSFFQWGRYEGLEFDLFWGTLFTVGSSITLSIAIIFGWKLREIMHPVWTILVAGVIIGMIAELWYYYLETFEAFYSSHVVNTIWISSFLLIVLSLTKYNNLEKSKSV